MIRRMSRRAEDAASLAVLQTMETGRTDCLPERGWGAAYGALFDGRFGDAQALLASDDDDSDAAAAGRAQVEALLTGAVRGGIHPRMPEAGSITGAMALFRWSEAAHIVGDMAGCQRMLDAAVQLAVPRRARVWLHLAFTRALLFRGDIDAARGALVAAAADAEAPLAQRSVWCVRVLLAGLSGNSRLALAEAEKVRAVILPARGYADSGMALTTSLGLAAVGALDSAAEILRLGSGGAGMPLLPPALRAYAYDVLIEAAVSAGQIDLAEWMILDFDRVDLGSNEQFHAAREAAGARIDIARGDQPRGMARADRARRQADRTGSGLVGARAAMIIANVMASSGSTGREPRDEPDAVTARSLERLLRSVSTAELRVWAEQRLASTSPPGAALDSIQWSSLTLAQEAVARLAAQGLRNQEIARILYLSPRTVEGHIAAIINKLGVSNRVGIARAGDGASTIDALLLARMTARQVDVARLMVAGEGNRAIAERLAISEKTVEKHLRGIYRTLGVASRVGAVAVLVGTVPAVTPGQPRIRPTLVSR